MGKSLLDLNRIQSLDSIFSKLKAVNSTDIMEVANEMLVPETLSSLIYTPENNGVY